MRPCWRSAPARATRQPCWRTWQRRCIPSSGMPPWQSRPGRFCSELGLHNVTVHLGDGSLGLPKYAPYQAIMVTAAAPAVPQPLLDQLADGGRLVIPVGSHGSQMLERWRRQGSTFDQEYTLAVAFVPLRGAHGWKE